MANETAIESTIRIGLALHCDIASWCRFARKNYFYPDMPKNFQISQYDEPLCVDGYLDVEVDGEDGPGRASSGCTWRRTPARRCTSAAPPGASTAPTDSLVDYNRAGIPLVEIVTKPVPGTGALAPEVGRAYVTELREVLRGLGVCDVRMEQGSLRCDVNLSLHRPARGVLGTRTETKNVNSLRSVERAVRFEIIRQAALLDARRPDRAGDPALPRGHRRHHARAAARRRRPTTATSPSPTWCRWSPTRRGCDGCGPTLPELPASARARLRGSWGASDNEMQSMANAGVVELVEATVAAGAPPAEARNWWLGDLAQQANEPGVELAELRITPAQVAELHRAGRRGHAADRAGPAAVEGVLATGADGTRSMAERGLRRVSDTAP